VAKGKDGLTSRRLPAMLRGRRGGKEDLSAQEKAALPARGADEERRERKRKSPEDDTH